MLVVWSPPESEALNIYRVGEEIVGQGYNKVWKRWVDKKFSIWVGVDENKTEYIFFKGEAILGDATVMVYYTRAARDKLKKAVVKAIEWSDVARRNQADTSKSLGCFGLQLNEFCANYGSAFDKNQMRLSFYAANGGNQTNLIISMIDRDNQFIETSIYVDVPEMKKMLNVIEKIESEFEKARKTAKDQTLFK